MKFLYFQLLSIWFFELFHEKQEIYLEGST